MATDRLGPLDERPCAPDCHPQCAESGPCVADDWTAIMEAAQRAHVRAVERAEQETERDTARHVLGVAEDRSGIDYEALPRSYDAWALLDAEEKGAALEGYFATVDELRRCVDGQ